MKRQNTKIKCPLEKGDVSPKLDGSSRKGRIALAGMMMKLFDHWGLSIKERAALLGLSQNSRSTLRRYQKGGPLANRKELLERAGNLLAIHRSLRILFPENREIVYKWPTLPNTQFEGLSPVELMKRDGTLGMRTVRQHLEWERER